ncbi:MAG: glycosyltransferase family 9 protein [Vampirovibrio sp.]|nr:glycosyltransferase family 9 protein [Vampirovibrio sp.]
MVDERILIVRLSAFGDIIQTLPLLAQVRKNYPTATIGWLVEEAGASILTNDELIDMLHVSKRKTWLKGLKSPLTFFQTLAEIRSFIAEIKTQRYTVVIDVQGLLKSAIWGWLAGIPKRIGFTPAREQAFRFYTHTHASFHPVKSRLHATQEFLCLLTLLDATYAIPTVEALAYPLFQQAEATLPFKAIDFLPESWLTERVEQRIIALAPCTAWKSKQWGAEQWVALAGLLINADYKVVWLGAKADEPWFASIWQGMAEKTETVQAQAISCVGKTDFQQLYQLFSFIDCLVGADSVAFHLANAKARNSQPSAPKLVGLFGATKPTRTGATFLPAEAVATMLQTVEALPCMPCHQRKCKLTVKPMACMQGISPQTVFESVEQLLLKQTL